MAQPTIDDEELKSNLLIYEQHGKNVTKAAEALGMPRGTLTNRLKLAKLRNLTTDDLNLGPIPPEHIRCTVNYKNDGGTIELISPTVPEPEEIFQRSGVDPEVWEIYDISIQDWTTPMKTAETRLSEDKKVLVKDEFAHVIRNYLIRVKIKPKKFAPFEKALREVVENLPEIKPAPFTILKNLNSKLAGELIPVDAHIAKLAWHQETGQGDMDLKLSSQRYLEGITKSLTHLQSYKPSKIYYVLGNDMMHYENIAQETWKGRHHLDSDSRLPKVIRRVVDLSIETIGMAEQVAPVKVVCIPGNHDYHANMWLAELLQRYYQALGNKNITIDPSMSPYKCEVFGNLLVIWMHDCSASKRKRAINDVPHRFRVEWGATKWSEVHYGHKHKKEEWETFKLSSPGQCIFRQCSGLTTIDFWHLTELFTDAVPASEAFLWDSKWGVEANFTSNVDWSECLK